MVQWSTQARVVVESEVVHLGGGIALLDFGGHSLA
jgi:hypothetical protein